jgi:drug/metabolite transporter (DMT)-like permease
MIYLIIVTLIWAFSFGLIKTQLTSIDPILVSFIRLSVSFVIFLPFFKFSRLKQKHITSLMFTGAVQYGLMYVCYISAYQFLKSYEIALLTIFTPLYVVGFHFLIEKKFNWKFAAAAAGAILGSGIILFNRLSSEDVWLGIILMQISNLAFAFGQIRYKQIYKTLEMAVKDSDIFATLYLGAILFIALLLPFRTEIALSGISVSQWYVLIYLGILPSGIGFFLWNIGARKINAGTLGVFNNLKIPAAMIVSLLVFGESANILKLILGSVILIASFFFVEKNNFSKG